MEATYWDKWTERQRSALEAMPGGRELIAHFGFVPSFHDAEIIKLDLQRRGPSTIALQYWKTSPDADSCIVEIVMGQVVDVVLDGFSQQNVVGDVCFLIPAPVRPDRERLYFPTTRRENEIEIVISPCYGLEGFIRCLDVSFVVGPYDGKI